MGRGSCNVGYPSQKQFKPKSREISFTHSLLPSCQIYLNFLPCAVQSFETIWQLRCHWPLGGNSPVAGEFPTWRASNAENVSISWNHHDSNSPRDSGPAHEHGSGTLKDNSYNIWIFGSNCNAHTDPPFKKTSPRKIGRPIYSERAPHILQMSVQKLGSSLTLLFRACRYGLMCMNMYAQTCMRVDKCLCMHMF